MSDSIEVRVARGAALLDDKRPGWFDEIDLRTLDLQSCKRCVLGQIFNGWSNGVNAVVPHDESIVNLGFDADDEENQDGEYDNLGVAWFGEVMKRRNGGGE